MSAYIVNEETISILAKAFLDYGVEYKAPDYNNKGGFIVFVDTHTQAIGQSLLNQNYKSVNYRYNEETPTPRFTYQRSIDDKLADLGLIYGCIRCYEYQACETNDYFESDIHKSLMRLKEKLLERAISRLGYDTHKWGYDPRDYQKAEEKVEEEVSYDDLFEALGEC